MQLKKRNYYHFSVVNPSTDPLFAASAEYNLFIQLLQGSFLSMADVLSYCILPDQFDCVLRVNDFGAQLKFDHQAGVQSALISELLLILKNYGEQTKRRKTTITKLTKQLKITTLPENARFQVILIDTCLQLHELPIQKGLVSNAEDWMYSSHNEYAEVSKVPICSKSLFYLLTELSPMHFKPVPVLRAC
jgi:hypothetical protein